MASKVYYHLGSFEDSLNFALGAGELFDVMSRSEYVDTTICKSILLCVCLMLNYFLCMRLYTLKNIFPFLFFS